MPDREDPLRAGICPCIRRSAFRGPGYFSQPSTSASQIRHACRADELLLALADVKVAEADCEADGELDAEAEALADGVKRASTLSFLLLFFAQRANIGGATGHGNRATAK